MKKETVKKIIVVTLIASGTFVAGYLLCDHKYSRDLINAYEQNFKEPCKTIVDSKTGLIYDIYLECIGD